MQCPHTDGWRKAEEGKKVCKLCGTVEGAEESWYLLPREGSKVIGRRATPSSKKTFRNKKATTIVDDSIRFHGAKLTVEVHNAHRWHLFRDRELDIAIAAERTVAVEEDGMKCSFSEHHVRVRMKKHKRGERPPSGAFVFELPKHVLKKPPLLIEFDESDEMVGVDLFLLVAKRRSSRKEKGSDK